MSAAWRWHGFATIIPEKISSSGLKLFVQCTVERYGGGAVSHDWERAEHIMSPLNHMGKIWIRRGVISSTRSRWFGHTCCNVLTCVLRSTRNWSPVVALWAVELILLCNVRNIKYILIEHSDLWRVKPISSIEAQHWWPWSACWGLQPHLEYAHQRSGS